MTKTAKTAAPARKLAKAKTSNTQSVKTIHPANAEAKAKPAASPAQIKAAARKALDALIEERAPMKALVAAVHKAGIPSDHAPAFVRQHVEARKAHVEDKPQPTRGDEQLAFAKAKAREKLDELVGKKAPVDQMVRAAQRAGIPTERAPGFVNQHLAAYIKGHDGKIPNAVLQSADKTALRAIAEAATHGKDAVKVDQLPRILQGGTEATEPQQEGNAEAKEARKPAALKARKAAPNGGTLADRFVALVQGAGEDGLTTRELKSRLGWPADRAIQMAAFRQAFKDRGLKLKERQDGRSIVFSVK